MKQNTDGRKVRSAVMTDQEWERTEVLAREKGISRAAYIRHLIAEKWAARAKKGGK